jgi:hypothetical protein
MYACCTLAPPSIIKRTEPVSVDRNKPALLLQIQHEVYLILIMPNGGEDASIGHKSVAPEMIFLRNVF